MTLSALAALDVLRHAASYMANAVHKDANSPPVVKQQARFYCGFANKTTCGRAGRHGARIHNGARFALIIHLTTSGAAKN